MIADAYKRWRHTRGYGVHSPFAFSIVTEVVQNPKGYEYYGYKEIETQAKTNRKERKFAKMLHRLCSRCDIGSVFVEKGLDTHVITSALKNSNSQLAFTTDTELIDNARLVICYGNENNYQEISRLLERPGRIIVIIGAEQNEIDSLFDGMDEGLLLYSPQKAIIFNRPGMQKVRYSINL